MLKRLKLIFLFLPFCLSGQQLGFALEQINAQAILKENLTGKGIKIGVIDGGFLRADQKESLKHLFENNLIAGYKDYLDSTALPYSGKKAWDDGHGTEVWELIAGYHPEKDVQYGLASAATYYLARTDHGGYERREEEENAIDAMEWMAKQGVRIINLSLGYNFGYTDKSENYKPKQMDGKSTILTQAINRFSNEYDILFVVAAGNDGDKKWRIIDSPADAERALTVGATKFKTWDNMTYSSQGPDWLSYVKPEVSCYASSGTSFSTPVITGLAACLLEKKPSLTSAELKQIIIQSASLKSPNNYTGYGVPDSEKALKLVSGETISPDLNEKISTKNYYKLILESRVPYVSAYHKKGWEVLEKETLRTNKLDYKIKRKAGATSTTLIWEDGQMEILWAE